MLKIENLAPFRSGVDYYIKELNVVIHQPTYKEISMIGEKSLFIFINAINLSIDEVKASNAFEELSENEINNLKNFDLFLYFIKEKELKKIFLSFMTLLFPNYITKIQNDSISLKYKIDTGDEIEAVINQFNFEIFKVHINMIFPMRETLTGEKYNTKGKIANEIKEKLLKGRMKTGEQSQEEDSIDVFGRYCLIISIGNSLDYDKTLSLTIAQINQQYIAYCHKREYENYKDLMLAGAKDLEPVQDWFLSTTLE